MRHGGNHAGQRDVAPLQRTVQRLTRKRGGPQSGRGEGEHRKCQQSQGQTQGQGQRSDCSQHEHEQRQQHQREVDPARPQRRLLQLHCAAQQPAEQRRKNEARRYRSVCLARMHARMVSRPGPKVFAPASYQAGAATAQIRRPSAHWPPWRQTSRARGMRDPVRSARNRCGPATCHWAAF